VRAITFSDRPGFARERRVVDQSHRRERVLPASQPRLQPSRSWKRVGKIDCPLLERRTGFGSFSVKRLIWVT
jgi:hypothetical protein